MRKYLIIMLCVVLVATLVSPFSAFGVRGRRRVAPNIVAQLQARINELTNLANEHLVQIQRLQNDVAFRDRIISELRMQIAMKEGAIASLSQIISQLQSTFNPQAEAIEREKRVIIEYYQRYLGRSPTQSEMDYWLRAAARYQGIEVFHQSANAISLEYYGRPIYDWEFAMLLRGELPPLPEIQTEVYR